MNKEQTELINFLSSEYEAWLVNAAFRIVGDTQTAKDIVQEAFWTACLRIDVLSAHEKPPAWMFVTVNNLAKREMDRSYHTEIHIDETYELIGETEVNLPMEYYLPAGLNEREREIIVWRLEKDLKFEEIAERYGIKVAACRKQYSRALAHCRELLQREENGIAPV